MLHFLLIVNLCCISINQIWKSICVIFKLESIYDYFDRLKITASLIEIAAIEYSYQHDLENISFKYPNIFQQRTKSSKKSSSIHSGLI